MSGVHIDSSDAELRFHLRWQPQVTLNHSPALPVGCCPAPSWPARPPSRPARWPTELTASRASG